MRVEVWFFNTPYVDLIKLRDWKGILLRAHCKYLGLAFTHCGLRVVTDNLDIFYQSTWDGLLAYETSTMQYSYDKCISINNGLNNVINIMNNIHVLFRDHAEDKITLNNILRMMYKTPELVDGMLCTSFIASALGIKITPDELYPDNLYNMLCNETKNVMSVLR